MECPTCRFQVSPGEVVEGACQVCGTDLRPERDQPGGSASDGKLLNMKDPGYGQDMGGNPLQEGILGDWQNRDVRDESFASVHGKLAYEEGDTAYLNQGPQQAMPLKVHRKDEGTGAYLVGSGTPDQANWYYPEQLNQHPDVEHAVRMLDPQNLTPEQFQHPDPWMDNEPGTLMPPTAKVRSDMYRKDSSVDDWQLARSDVDMPYWHRTAAVGEAQLHPNGIHNGVAALLRFLQPKIGGLDAATQARDIVNTYSPFRDLTGQQPGWQEFLAQNPTVQVETLYDEYLPVVQDIIMNEGQPSQVPDSLKQLAQQMHAGAVPFPPGISPEQVKIANFEREAFLPALAMGARAVAPALLRGAAGAGKKVLPGAMKGLKGAGSRFLMFQGLQNLMGGQQGAAGQLPSTPPQPRTYQQMARSIHADLGGDLSVPELGVQDGDPEKVDPHEINDGDTTNMYRQDVNDMGGTADAYQGEQVDDPNFSTGDEHFDKFLDSIPKLIQYYESDESGLDDPDIRALIEQMDAADPEWQNNTEELEAILQHTSALPGQMPGIAPNYMPAQTGNPAPQVPGMGSPDGGVNGACNVCGAGLNADGTCPAGHQGGAGVRQPLPGLPATPQMQQAVQPIAKVAINDHQGPKNAEQFSAVADLLMEQGREMEIPGMLKEPWKYSEELAQVQMKPNMPPEDLSAPEEAPAADPGAAPMPVPQPQGMPLASVTAALTRVGADSVAPRCPKCDSATTGVISDEGECRCHRCQNVWTPDGAQKEKISAYLREATPRIEAPTHDELHSNEPGVSEADQLGQEDLRQEDNSGKTWTTSDGESLRVGDTYELHSEQFSIPDLVQVEAIKPDAVNLKFIGEYSAHGGPEEEQLAYEHEISREEAELGNYSFQPTQVSERDQDSELGEENQAVDPDVGPGDQTDMSTPHDRLTHRIEELVRTGVGLKQATAQAQKESVAWDDPAAQGMLEDFGKNMMRENQEYYDQQKGVPADSDDPLGIGTPGMTWKQGQPGRGIIDEQGQVHAWPESDATHAQWIQSTGIQPTNFFSLGPDGSATPFSWEGEGQFSPTDEQALTQAGFRLPEVAEDAGDIFNFASVPDSHDKAMAEETGEPIDPDLAWLKGGSVEEAPVEAGDEVDPDLSWLREGGFEERTAGRHYTPSQQKEFVDEEGEARNRDKLKLEGTHYTGYDSAPEEHPGLFL